MYFFLILFFISLVGILVMLGRKLALVSNGQIPEIEYEHPFILDFQKIKDLTIEGVKKYGHTGLVITLRYYIKSTNFIKNKYGELKTKLKNKIKKDNINTERKEVSKFLKMISEYKHKIREIKHKIHEEEKKM